MKSQMVIQELFEAAQNNPKPPNFKRLELGRKKGRKQGACDLFAV